MVDNEEERKNMKRARYLFLVLFSSLPVMWGCSRRTLLDDYPVTGINISLNWEGVTDHLPEGVRVIFYPKGCDLPVNVYSSPFMVTTWIV